MRHYHFFYVSTDVKWQTCSPPLLFFVDENEKLSINEVLEVLISVETFTSTISFDTQSLQFVTMNKLKKSVPGWLYFLLGSSIQCLLSVGIRSYFTKRDVCRKMRQMYLSIVEEYFSVEDTHNLRIGLINTSPKKLFCWFYSVF